MTELRFVPEQSGTTEHNFLHMTEFITKYHVEHNITTQNLLEVDDQVDRAFHSLVQPHLQQATDLDLIGVQVLHEELERPIFLSYVHAKEFSATSFTNRIYAITQSNTSFLLTGTFDVTVSLIRRVSAGHPPAKRGLNRPVTVSMARHLSKSLVNVPSTGNDCGHIAVFLGNFHIESFFDLKRWKAFTDKRWRNKALQRSVTKFVSNVNKSLGVSISLNEPVTLDTLDLYAKHLNTSIVVFQSDERTPTSQARHLFLSSNTAPPERRIYLELLKRNDNTLHYNLITRPAAYFRSPFFCHSCLVPYSSNHLCPNSKCSGCSSSTMCGNEAQVQCSNCGHMCFTEQCLERHQQQRECKARYMCPSCLVTMKTNGRASHQCLTYFCTTCSTTYTHSPHYCFIKPLKTPADENLILTVFDIESMFVMSNGVETHQPVLLVALTVCSVCYKANNVLARDGNCFRPLKERDCDICLSYEHVYRGEDCVQRFCDYVYKTLAPRASQVSRNMQVRVLAHNLKSYDGRFILRDYFTRNFESSNVIMQGTKVLCLDVANVRFQDSLNLFMCALRKLPKTFNFSERVQKGEFPYMFNRPENVGYIGPVPPLESYGYEKMKPDDQATLLQYYECIKHRTDYNLQQEMERYCYADAEILLIAVMAFRDKFKAIAGFDPIRRNFTLPSMSMATFRRQFLTDNTLAVTPAKPYSSMRKCSTICKIYLDIVEEQSGVTLMREYRLGKVFADAFDLASHTAYEFLGCLFHGCPVCYPNKRDEKHPVTNKTPNALYQAWVDKQQYYDRLRQLIPDLKLQSEWECNFRQTLTKNEEVKAIYDRRLAYYSRLQKVGPCDLRESYCGGRTENFHFMKSCSPHEVIELVDFNSLYPYVLAKYPYPVGHPVVISDHFEQFIQSTSMSSTLFGFVKCRVLPPKQMHIPILPMKYNGRLEFVLCNQCGVENAKSFCKHDDNQRCLVSTFSTAELSDALHHGYRVMEVFEILHWPSSSDELFRPYIYKWIKMKSEASGFPGWIKSDSDKDAYIDKYFKETATTGHPISLDKAAIRKDEISRNIAKNLLNSFYGKFAEKQNKEATLVIKDYATLWKLANDSNKIITGVITVDTNKLLVNWRFKEDHMAKSNGIVNIAIASFVTSYARRELWRAINKLEIARPGCVYYSDTDSIFFTTNRGDCLVSTGHNLGELVREVASHEEITALVVLGPKNYAYVVRNRNDNSDRIVIKVKGITLDAKTLKCINFQLLTKMCEAFIHQGKTLEYRVEQSRIHSTKDQTVCNRVFTKVYRAVCEKRLVCGNDSYPKGTVCLMT